MLDNINDHMNDECKSLNNKGAINMLNQTISEINETHNTPSCAR